MNRRTDVEETVVNAIAAWRQVKSYGPSFRDIATTTGLALGTVHDICERLRKEGRVHYEDNVARSLSA